MPLGKVFNAAENQVLFKPVSSYYQGKAIRLALENKALANEALQKEVEGYDDAQARAEQKAQREADAAKRAEAKHLLDMNTAEQEDVRNANQAGLDRLEETGSLEEATAAWRVAAEAGPATPDLEGVPDDWVFDPDRARAQNAVFESSAPPNPTANMQVLDDLVAKGAITIEQRNQYLEDQQKKAGTITGTTEHDPRTSLSKSGISQITTDYRGKVAMAATGAASATELVNISYQSPAALAKSGAIINFGNEIQKTAKNLMEVMNPDPLPSSETEKQTAGYDSFDWTELDKKSKKLGLSIENAARFKSGIYSIAFSAAVGEQGSRPSDKDIQWYIDIYGGGITDGKVFRATIATAMRRQYNMLKFTAELNPEIKDSAASLAVFEKPYNEFLSAIEGGKRITPPETAIQHLKEHPELADQFKKKYGFLPEGI